MDEFITPCAECPWGKCDHDPITRPNVDCHGKVLEWFKSDEIAMEALRTIILDKTWLESLRYYVRFRYVYMYMYLLYIVLYNRHTGQLESYHNLVLMYNAKRIHYRYVCVHLEVHVLFLLISNTVFYACTVLAALDHNRHLNRSAYVSKDGNEQYHRVWRRRSKEWDVVARKEGISVHSRASGIVGLYM